MESSITTISDANKLLPNDTALTPVNPLPEMVTWVPPKDEPLFGVMLVMIGGSFGKYVNCVGEFAVPPRVFTVISTLPDDKPLGVVTLIVLGVTLLIETTGVVPK